MMRRPRSPRSGTTFSGEPTSDATRRHRDSREGRLAATYPVFRVASRQ
jgi:hypothetical protein